MKLHLGCGQKYLDGYVNIDYPITEHSVQKEIKVDKHANIKEISYPSSTIQEVRLHHVFEHFNRPEAFALICSWSNWLKDDGILHIEVPDFFRTSLSIISPFSSMNTKLVGIRHLFGSHEAHWAYHFEGYSAHTLRHILNVYGFEVQSIIKSSWKKTYNIEVIARKKVAQNNFPEVAAKTINLFNEYLLDPSEKDLADYWMNLFEIQFQKSFPH